MRPTHTEFEDYFRFHAQAAQAEKEMKPLKAKILAWLEDGNASPADLPYLAVIRTQQRTQWDWKGALQRVLKGILRADAKVEARMTEIEQGFDKQPVTMLCVEINHSYAAKQ